MFLLPKYAKLTVSTLINVGLIITNSLGCKCLEVFEVETFILTLEDKLITLNKMLQVKIIQNDFDVKKRGKSVFLSVKECKYSCKSDSVPTCERQRGGKCNLLANTSGGC